MSKNTNDKKEKEKPTTNQDEEQNTNYTASYIALVNTYTAQFANNADSKKNLKYYYFLYDFFIYRNTYIHICLAFYKKYFTIHYIWDNTCDYIIVCYHVNSNIKITSNYCQLFI